MQADEEKARRKKKTQEVKSYMRLPGSFYSLRYRFYAHVSNAESLVRFVRRHGITADQRRTAERLMVALDEALKAAKRR